MHHTIAQLKSLSRNREGGRTERARSEGNHSKWTSCESLKVLFWIFFWNHRRKCNRIYTWLNLRACFFVHSTRCRKQVAFWCPWEGTWFHHWENIKQIYWLFDNWRESQRIVSCLWIVETIVSWLEDRISDTGNEAEIRESTLSAHAYFLIKNVSKGGTHLRYLCQLVGSTYRKVSLGSMEFLLSTFPTIFSWGWVAFYAFQWSCMVATICSSYQKFVREWIINSLSYAPWTNQGLL